MEKQKAAQAAKYQYRRFDEECNDRYRLGGLEELTDKVLTEFVNHHINKQRPRLEELRDYYKSQNRTIAQRKPREPHLSDKRLAHAYARYISAFIQGYLVGTPIKVQHPDQPTQSAVQELNKNIQANSLNSDLTLDLSIYGRAYDMVHRNQADQDRVYRLSPRNAFIIYDDTIEEKPLAGARYWADHTGRLHADVYTATEVRHHTAVAAGTLVLDADATEAHYFGDVPITEYANNRFRQGDFEPVLDDIDAYDEAQSDTGNYMTDLNDAMLVISGDVALEVSDAQAMKEANLLLLIPAKDIDGKPQQIPTAQYIYKQYDVNGVESYKKRLQQDIHRFTNTPDMADENFSGNASGESMKYKLFGLDQVRAEKETRMTAGLRRRYQLLFTLKDRARERINADANDLEFIFTPNIPRAFYEELKAFSEAGGQLSQETLLTITALVDSPQAEVARIEAETAKRMTPMYPYEDTTTTADLLRAPAPE